MLISKPCTISLKKGSWSYSYWQFGMASNSTVSILEQSRVAPPPSTVAADLSLPLTFFDMLTLNGEQIRSLLFYDFAHNKSYFLEKTIPHFKTSLSNTLKHFLPLAGNLLYPTETGDPTLSYVMGASVALNFSECSDDFHFLKGNHPLHADRFTPFLPETPLKMEKSCSKQVSLLSVQVTLFPNNGLIVGISIHHVAGDACALALFSRVWTSISRARGGDSHLLNEELPMYDRTIIKDPFGLASMIWNELKKKNKHTISRPLSIPNENVRATFIVANLEIQKLKNLLLTKRPGAARASSFVVTCAYIWTCFVRARHFRGEVANREETEETEHLIFPAECRGHFSPPLPNSYFGNCSLPLVVASKNADLIGKDGFLISADLIGNMINKELNNEEEIWKKIGKWLLERKSLNVNPERALAVTSSAKFDPYNADYGWGKPQKVEFVDAEGAYISLNKSLKCDGDMEANFALPITKMNAFASIYNDGLRTFDCKL